MFSKNLRNKKSLKQRTDSLIFERTMIVHTQNPEAREKWKCPFGTATYTSKDHQVAEDTPIEKSGNSNKARSQLRL
jgi:hypothetical protein